MVRFQDRSETNTAIYGFPVALSVLTCSQQLWEQLNVLFKTTDRL